MNDATRHPSRAPEAATEQNELCERDVALLPPRDTERTTFGAPGTVQRLIGAALIGAVALSMPACEQDRSHDRWVVTEDTTVDLDWDAVAEAYRLAEGPEDLERRVNEIYTGDEVISVSVRDLDEKTQVVTGFFDKNTDGHESDDERIFSIRRDIQGDEGQYQIQGYGPYAYYHSPFMSIATGMLLGSMLSNAFSPGYAPRYTQPYVTSPAQRGQLVNQRNAYRTANPEQYKAASSKAAASKASRAGSRTYGARGKSFGGGRPASPPRMPSRGGRFGVSGRAGRRIVLAD